MIIIDDKEYFRIQLRKEKLVQSLEMYRWAIINNYEHELPLLLRRVEYNQREFHKLYEK